jgi:hypothetical protein
MNALFLRYSPDGVIRWAKTAGSADWANRGDAVALDRNGIAYVAGFVGASPRFDSLQYAGGNVNSFVGCVSSTGVTTVREDGSQRSFALYQNYPNPFNPRTEVGFQIGHGRQVSLRVHDILGREVATLVDGEMNPGTYTVPFDASHLSSGVYFSTLRSGTFVATRKLVLTR